MLEKLLCLRQSRFIYNSVSTRQGKAWTEGIRSHLRPNVARRSADHDGNLLPPLHTHTEENRTKRRSRMPKTVQHLLSFYLHSSKADPIWWLVERCREKRPQQGFYKHIKGVGSQQQGEYRRHKAAPFDAGKRNNSFEWTWTAWFTII